MKGNRKVGSGRRERREFSAYAPVRNANTRIHAVLGDQQHFACCIVCDSNYPRQLARTAVPDHRSAPQARPLRTHQELPNAAVGELPVRNDDAVTRGA